MFSLLNSLANLVTIPCTAARICTMKTGAMVNTNQIKRIYQPSGVCNLSQLSNPTSEAW